MTIATDVMATTPYLYWKLDDPTGPAASDSSGNSHPGVYTGTFSLGQFGPEQNTKAAQFAASSGVQATTGVGLASNVDHTYGCYFTYPSASGTTFNTWMNFGNGSTRGTALTGTLQGFIRGNRMQTSSTAQTSQVQPGGWLSWWHHMALTYVASSGTVSLYLDGTFQVTIAATISQGTGVDAFSINCPYGAVVAHVTLWNRAVTAGELASIANHMPLWPYGMPTNYLPLAPSGGGSVELNPSDPVVVDLNADLADIHRAVIHDYTTGAPGT